MPAAQVDASIAGNLAVTVVQAPGVVQAQRSPGGDQAALVVQHAVGQVEAQPGFADQPPLLLDQFTHLQVHVALGGDFAALGGVELVGSEVEPAGAVDQAGATIVDLPGIQAQALPGADQAGAVVQAASLHIQGLAGDQAILAVVQAADDQPGVLLREDFALAIE